MVDRRSGYQHPEGGEDQKTSRTKEALAVFGEVSVKYPASIGGQAVLIEQRCRQGKIRNFQSAHELLSYLVESNLSQDIADSANHVHGAVSAHRTAEPGGEPLKVRQITAVAAQSVLEEEIDLAEKFAVLSDQDLEDLLDKVKQPTMAEALKGRRTSDLVTHIQRVYEHRKKSASGGQVTPAASPLGDPDSHYY